MKSINLNECSDIISNVGKEHLLYLYRELKKRHLTMAKIKRQIDKEEINNLFKEKKSAAKVINIVSSSKNKVYRLLQK
jgi:hypothetical protein